MSADKLVFDLSQEIEGSPQVFIKKDWLSILDNMNTNYNSNQTIIDTSQLSNSNKYMSYREAYLAVPLLLTLSCSTAFNAGTASGISPATANIGEGGDLTVAYPTGCDYAIGLKNWFGSMFHSITLDMNGTTIIQQTPLINMVNSFRLMTTLSWADVVTQGATIGFYPDSASSWTVTGSSAVAYDVATASCPAGRGVCNNTLFPATDVPFVTNIDAAGLTTFLAGSGSVNLNAFQAGAGNKGFLKRIQYVNLDLEAPAGFQGAVVTSQGTARSPTPVPLSGVVTNWATQWNSYISQKAVGVIQTSILATVYLKHLHNFFAMIPLVKGTFFKLTCFLNNGSTNFTIANKTYTATNAGTASASNLGTYTAVTSSVPVGGVLPIMLAETSYAYGGAGGLGNGSYTASIAVGGKTLVTHTSATAPSTGQLSQSIYLYVPSYTFNPVFENAYLSQPVKSIKYSDYYQYQVIGVKSGNQFNNLLTNGIANIKSVLILPFYSASEATGAQQSGLPAGMPVYQSPFDPAGTGPTSPLCMFSNFNVVVSGQNAIYNTERYNFEQFNNQFKGCNSVNGDMTDGLTSGLLSAQDWQREYCYWYVNVSRMLPVEESVPKSIQIIGQNNSGYAVDLICFIEYGCSVDIDALTGARV
jgi:hypothetical protein